MERRSPASSSTMETEIMRIRGKAILGWRRNWSERRESVWRDWTDASARRPYLGAEMATERRPSGRESAYSGFPTLAPGHEFGDGFGAGLDVEFFVNAAQITAHGGGGDVEFGGNLFVGVAFGQELKDHLFAGRKAGGPGRGRALERSDDFAGNGGRHGRAAFVDVANGLKEVGGALALEDVAGGAGGEGLEDAVVILVDCQHDNDHFGMALFEAGDAFDAVDAGHVDVHEDDVRAVVGQAAQGVGGGGVGADAVVAGGAVDEGGHGTSELSLIVEEGNGDHRGRSAAWPFKGMRKCTATPRPGWDSTWQEPPTSARRSRMLRRPLPAAGESAAGSKPAPLSEATISKVAALHLTAMRARVALECLRVLVRASWTAWKRWCRNWEERA